MPGQRADGMNGGGGKGRLDRAEGAAGDVDPEVLPRGGYGSRPEGGPLKGAMPEGGRVRWDNCRLKPAMARDAAVDGVVRGNRVLRKA